jgi:hypothetical protein
MKSENSLAPAEWQMSTKGETLGYLDQLQSRFFEVILRAIPPS